MQCELCTAPLTPATARVQTLNGRKQTRCESCEIDAVVQSGGTVKKRQPGYEYHFFLLAGSDGTKATEDRLNAWTEKGWRVMPFLPIPGMGLLERRIGGA